MTDTLSKLPKCDRDTSEQMLLGKWHPQILPNSGLHKSLICKKNTVSVKHNKMRVPVITVVVLTYFPQILCYCSFQDVELWTGLSAHF